jgi:hypothetical protein
MRAYIGGIDATGTVRGLELPTIEYNQKEYAGLGMAGTMELPENVAPLEFTIMWLHYPPEFSRAIYDGSFTSQIILRGEQKTYDGRGIALPQQLSMTMRGRPKEAELGSFEDGETSEPQTVYACDYLMVQIGGAVQYEFDVLNGIKVGGNLLSLFGL